VKPLAGSSDGKAFASGPQALLVAGERLMAENGITGASMRRIVTAAGQGNNYAVQHHFGSKMGLVRAILEMRMSEINLVREKYLDKAVAKGDPDVRSLVEANFMPIAELVDEHGVHVFARFRARVSAELGIDPWGLIEVHAPAGKEIVARLQTKLAHLDEETFWIRIELVTSLFLAAIASRDPGELSRPMHDRPETFLSQVITMCAAALEAP
jgi:AcrR family transcriptional regulator